MCTRVQEFQEPSQIPAYRGEERQGELKQLPEDQFVWFPSFPGKAATLRDFNP